MKDDRPNLSEYIVKIQNKPIVNLSRKALQQTPLSKTALAVILGSVLGGGSLKMLGKFVNARLSIRHSVVQEMYFYKKVNLLHEIRPKGGGVNLQNPDGYSKKQKLLFQSSALPSLTTIWNSIGGNSRTIKRSWLNHCTPLSLTIWWCDDGHVGTTYGVFSTNSFSYKEHEILQQYLKNVWDVETQIQQIWYRHKRKLDQIENQLAQTLSNSSENIEGVSPSAPEVLLEEGAELPTKTLSVSTSTTRAPYGSRVNADGFKSAYMLQLTFSNLEKFLSLCLPHCPCKDMLYKFIIPYNNTTDQQRWISHMESLLPPDLALLVQSAYSSGVLFAKRNKSVASNTASKDLYYIKSLKTFSERKI